MSTTLAIVQGWIEFEGRRIARLESGLPPTLVYRLEETFAEIDEDELDEEIEQLIRAMADAGRPQNLAARMARARMRLVAEVPDSRASASGERS